MYDKFYIKKFIRDDGMSLELDAEELYLDVDNTLLVRPEPNTTAVSFTEADGGEMLRQRLDVTEQVINGVIVPKTTPYWSLVEKLVGFFKINHIYKIIYVKKDGAMFAVSNAWISTSLQIPPTAREEYSRWTLGLTLGNDYWREYTENASGEETYANSVEIPLLTSAVGGEDWDDVGLVLDDVGEVWIAGGGGIQSIMISSTTTIYSICKIVGPCVNPRIQNNTTDTEAVYNGTVADGQTLIIDFESGEARLDGALVTRLVTGIISCVPGENLIGFNSDGGSTDSALLSWNNIIG